MSLSARDQVRTIQLRIREEVERLKQIRFGYDNSDKPREHWAFSANIGEAIASLRKFDSQICEALEALDD